MCVRVCVFVCVCVCLKWEICYTTNADDDLKKKDSGSHTFLQKYLRNIYRLHSEVLLPLAELLLSVGHVTSSQVYAFQIREKSAIWRLCTTCHHLAMMEKSGEHFDVSKSANFLEAHGG